MCLLKWGCLGGLGCFDQILTGYLDLFRFIGSLTFGFRF